MNTGRILATLLAVLAAGQIGTAIATAAAGATPTAWPATAPFTATTQPPSGGYDDAALAAWRADREAALIAPNGWLSLVGLEWLDEGTNTLGSAEDADVHFPARTPARLGTITRHGATLRLEPAPGAPLTVDGKPAPASLPLLSDVSEGGPTIVALGEISFFAISRGDRIAVRIKDSESPVRKAFHGLDHYPTDPSWRVVARFVPAATGTTIAVPNVLGMLQPTPSAGEVVFTYDGRELRLPVIGDADEGLSFVFGDATNGHGTYGGGRFLDVDAPKTGDETVVLDFNFAYNPPCVFTPFATCPLPPKGSTLAVAVEAGEKVWSGHPPG